MSWADHWSARAGMIGAHRAQIGPAANLLVGDSHMERLWWNAFGPAPNKPTYRFVNAGMGGIDDIQIVPFLPAICGGAPHYAFVLLGTNSAIPEPGETQLSPERVAEFSANYQQIIDTLKAKGTNVILGSIPPIEPGKALSDTRSQAAVNQLNSVIVYQKSQPQNLRLVNLNTMFMANGAGEPGSTTDGIHLTPANNVQLHYAIGAAVKAEIAETGIPG